MRPIALITRPGQIRLRWRYRRRHRAWALSLMAIALLLLLLSVLVPARPWLVLNLSASMPLGLYQTQTPRPLSYGDIVAARLPYHAARFAAQRGYLPSTSSLIKTVAALPGDLVCAMAGRIMITRQQSPEPQSVERHLEDAQGRKLPFWQDCRELQHGEVMLLGQIGAASFDSRYLGPLRSSSVIARLVPLWTE